MATILIVDDQPDNLYVLERLLRGQGYAVLQAPNGEAALDSVRTDRPDLVLLDVMMPGMDGFEVVRHLRDDPHTRGLPVVLLTANAPDQRLKIQGLNLGADEYLTQPINNSELLARVRALLRSKQAQDDLKAVNSRLQTLLDVVQASTSTLDLAEVGERVVRGALQAAAMEVGGIWQCEGPDLVALSHVGYSAGFIEERQRITHEDCPIMHKVVDTRIPISGSSTKLFGADDPWGREAASMIMLPLHLRDEGLGLLQLGTRQSRTFTQEDIQFLGAIAGAAATAMQNARLFAESVENQRKLEEVNREKDEFVSIVTHELKNPLASIKGYASLLLRRARKDPALQPSTKGLDVIEQQVARMTLLLDQLRDVSHIGINRFNIDPQALDLAELVERVASELQGTTTDHEMTLRLPNLPLMVSVDEFRMSQVFSNLIGNAIKYSPAGTTIDIAVESVSSAAVPLAVTPGKWVCVEISDHGIGIAPEEQERLFERFFRASNAKGKARGMGLGLFIAREIVLRHGGQMWVRSTPGKGSTFSLILPLIDDAASADGDGPAVEQADGRVAVTEDGSRG